jgi:hypothetical protein
MEYMLVRPEIDNLATGDTVNQAIAEYAANTYLSEVLADEYRVGHGVQQSGAWQFPIQYQTPALNEPIPVGTLVVDARSGKVRSLADDEVQDIRERAATQMGLRHGELARDEEGYILPYLAKVKVSGYLGNYVAFFARAEGRPRWIAGNPPRWQVNTALCLRDHGKVCELGTIEVNALTGEVFPLTADQIQAMQRQARDAATRAKRSSASAG